MLDAVRFLASRKIGLALVCDAEGSLVGVLSERDVIRSIAARGAQTLAMTVDPFITTDVVTCRSTDRVIDVAQMMSQRRIRHVPVVDDGILKGMISATDIVNFYAHSDD